jgi:phosphoribosylformylglycinamidine synthase II
MQLDDRRVRVSELTDEQLAKDLAQHGVGLTPFEARRIVELIGHDPTLTELHIFNVEWSEHCSYKSSRATLKQYLPTDAPNVILGPQEDAGIIELCVHEGRRYGVVIAHESHNHPSQVLPREGAATGIGGIVRDVDCMGARVIATGDPLRFGSLHSENVERTRWIVDGVVEGIWQYGNALGVPNLGGDVYFRDAFDDNCLVNVVSLGVVAEEDIIHSAAPLQAADEPYDLILVGKPTDDSGFGGSAFASKVLSEEEQAEDRAAVQVDDPFLKNVLAMRKANEAVREAAKRQGYAIGIKDLGGGGFACGSSEITAAGGFGVEIDLDEVHVGLENLLPETICCAETQERYVLAVPRRFTPEVLRIYNEDWDLPNVYEGACARVVGTFNNTKRYVLKHQGKIVCDAPVEAVTAGIAYEREARPREHKLAEPDVAQPADLGAALLRVLGHENVCSREYIYRAYDTEVQGNAVIRPGEADAGVCAPLEGCLAGVALAMDGNPAYGAISPYWGGANAVVEACRNVAAVGATPAGLTDCLNYGNPETPAAFWEFREGVRGIADAAKQIGLKGHAGSPVPVVSGNVSFYNESATGRAVEPSGILACVGVMQDCSKAVTMQLKYVGDSLYLIGPRYDECGGSAYYQALGLGLGANVPQVRWDEQRAAIYGVIDAIDAGLVAACHDISDGGLAVTIAEMVLGGYATGRLGAQVDPAAVSSDLRIDKLLFSESGGFVAEVRAGSEAAFEALFDGRHARPVRIGGVMEEPRLDIAGTLSIGVADLAEAWTTGLARRLR